MSTAATRAHLYWPVTDENGDMRLYVQVRLYQIDGVTPYAGKIYRDRLSLQEWSNPFVAAPALLDLYLEDAAQIRLGLTPDPSKPELVTEIIDVAFDADLSVTSRFPQRVVGQPQGGALLCGTGATTAIWKPLRIDHEHAMIAPGTVLAGRIPNAQRQVGGYSGSTTLGVDTGGYRAASSLDDVTMLGVRAVGAGRGTVAAGHDSVATEGLTPPWRDGAVTLGATRASDQGVAVGVNASAQGAVSVGQNTAGGFNSLAVGSDAYAAPGGIAIGRGAGALSPGPDGSVGIGAGTSYGLPSDPVNWAVMLGGFDPAAPRTFSYSNSATAAGFPWANPLDSQSESPFRETGATMAFTGKTVQIQRHLTWLADLLALQVLGDVTLGGQGGKIGFYGATPGLKPDVGEDEPGTGIPALDNLIIALRQLGLLQTRTEPLATYRAEDMATAYRHGDLVPRWTEHAGNDVAVNSPVGRALPSFYDPDPEYNNRPTVSFINGVDRESVKPIEELRGAATVDQMKHVIVVAQHPDEDFGLYEGMVNLTGPEQIRGQNTIFMANTRGSSSWQMVNASKYTVDGLNQTRNGSAWLDDDGDEAHVYRMTCDVLWPRGRLIIGGPRDQEEAGNTPRNWDNFTGSIAEIVGVDDTWAEADVSSMERGLAFLYGIRQDYSELLGPAVDFIVESQDPVAPAHVDWSDDYDDDDLGRVYGNVYRISTPLVATPYIMTFDQDNLYTTRDPIAGYYGNLPGPAANYEVQVSVFDWHGDHSRYDFDIKLDVPLNFDPGHETEIGIFALNNNGTWSTGRQYTQYGHKVARIRDKVTKAVLVRSGGFPTWHQDTDVRVYSTKSDGTLLLEGTSPLWGYDPAVGDTHGFGVRVNNVGRKVLRVYQTSTNTLLASTDAQDTALPRTTVYASDDPDVSASARDTAHVSVSALAAMSLLEVGWLERRRARKVLATLGAIVGDDGSFNLSYSAATPTKLARGANPADLWGGALAVLAVLRYTAATGDTQFVGLAQKIGDFLSTATITATRDLAGAYFALRDLGAYTGTASYTTAAQTVRTTLLGSCWDTANGRWFDSTTTQREDLWADAMGGLFALAIGDRGRARATVAHLRRFRVRNLTISASHYAGPSGVTGYKPYAELGANPYVNPPSVIDQAGTWVAILFKARFGDPIGDDVESLLEWEDNYRVNDPSNVLFGEQFLSYNTDYTTGGYTLRARPNVAVAAWARMLGNGGRWLFTVDPLPSPVASNLTFAVVRTPGASRITFAYAWTRTGGPAAAYEAIPEWSTDGGTTWTAFSSRAISASIEAVRAPTGPDDFAATWSAPVPSNTNTLYRTRVRMRNAAFGPWTTSLSMAPVAPNGYGTALYGLTPYAT